jgi:hypothetical protein
MYNAEQIYKHAIKIDISAGWHATAALLLSIGLSSLIISDFLANLLNERLTMRSFSACIGLELDKIFFHFQLR